MRQDTPIQVQVPNVNLPPLRETWCRSRRTNSSKSSKTPYRYWEYTETNGLEHFSSYNFNCFNSSSNAMYRFLISPFYSDASGNAREESEISIASKPTPLKEVSLFATRSICSTTWDWYWKIRFQDKIEFGCWRISKLETRGGISPTIKRLVNWST